MKKILIILLNEDDFLNIKNDIIDNDIIDSDSFEDSGESARAVHTVPRTDDHQPVHCGAIGPSHLLR